MEAPKATLTRTHSSLLRSSPTVRSSIHSLSDIQPDVEEQKPHQPRPRPASSAPCRRCFAPSAPLLALLVLSSYTLFVFSLRDGVPASENLLLALLFVAVLLILVGRNKRSIHRSFSFLRDLCERRFRFSKSQARPVQWFIGDSNKERRDGKSKHQIVREGVEFYSNGDFYEGEFHKGSCNGSGVYSYFAKGRYEGDWIDGKYDGYGVESWSRGSKYRGQYRQGLRHGYGVYRFYTGDSYAGEWCNGQSHGIGVQTCSDGSCYIGEFKLGVKHGLGSYHFRNGDKYAGEYFGDKIHGFGVYHFANGHCYEGSWHEGRKQGYGMYIFQNGVTRCGEWDTGQLKSSLPPHTDEIQRAVQAARKAAENAINIRRVDEQVDRAVMAANKAATAARVAAIKAVQNRMDGKFCDTNI